MRSSLALILALCLGACGLLPEQVDETKGWSANKLYSEAKTNLEEGNYEKAVKLYEKLEARYPYGRFAQQAQLARTLLANATSEDLQAALAAWNHGYCAACGSWPWTIRPRCGCSSSGP